MRAATANNDQPVRRFHYFDQHDFCRSVHLCAEHEKMLREIRELHPFKYVTKLYCDLCKAGVLVQ